MKYVGHFGEEVAKLQGPLIPQITPQIEFEAPPENTSSGSSSDYSFFQSSTKNNNTLIIGLAFFAAAGFAAYAIWGSKSATPNPIKRGYSRSSISTNIRREIRRGRSPKQAAAIAYSIARKEQKRRGLSIASLKR
jgi:hypothetical protein